MRLLCWSLTLVLALSGCSRGPRHTADRTMTWSEETSVHGLALPQGQKVIVLRFQKDPGQGLIENWSPELLALLKKSGNPVRITFEYWTDWKGKLTFFNPVAVNGVPWLSNPPAQGPNRAASFSEPSGRLHPLD